MVRVRVGFVEAAWIPSSCSLVDLKELGRNPAVPCLTLDFKMFRDQIRISRRYHRHSKRVAEMGSAIFWWVVSPSKEAKPMPEGCCFFNWFYRSISSVIANICTRASTLKLRLVEKLEIILMHRNVKLFGPKYARGTRVIISVYT